MPLSPLSLVSSLRRYGAAFGLALALTGCASLSSPPVPEAGPLVVRHYHDNIALAGRMSIRYTQNDQEQALHGSFTWDQDASHIVMHLLSPLGQTLATIDIRPGIAVLQQSGKAPLSATDINLLTEQALGWPLPISGLRDWLQGFGRTTAGQAFIAQPSTEVRNYDSADGWKLSYGEWQDDGANTAQNHPKRLDLSRQTRQAGPVAIRIVIDKWQLPAAAGKS